MMIGNILGLTILRPVTNPGIMVTGDPVGVEVEIENNSSSRVDRLSNWNVVGEGSINGFEAVLSQPMGGLHLVQALQELEDALSERTQEQMFSEMTSTHIHINVTDLTADELFSFITLAIMFEPVLYNYVAPHRNKNHFCLPMSDADDVLVRLAQVVMAHRRGDLSRGHFSTRFSMNQCKYAGINLSSIARYGSLEFRMHQGTSRTTDIIRWVNILLTLKEHSRGRSPVNILETKVEMGIMSQFVEILGNYSGILTYEGIEDDILDGIRNAQDFVALYNIPVGRGVLSDIPNSDRFNEQYRALSVEDGDDWDDEEDEDDDDEWEM